MEILETLFGSVTEVTWQMAVMWLIGGALLIKSCSGERDYRLHPVTSNEADAHDAMHTR